MGKYVFVEGEEGGTGGPVSADAVSYATSSDPSIANVKDALDKLLYVAPSISMSGGATYEIGQTVHGVHLTWSFNKPIVSQSLDHGIGALALDVRSYDWPDDITANTSFQLTASDGETTAHGSTSVIFQRKAYWGAAAQTTLDNAAILALSQAFATSRAKSVTYDCSGGRYPYYCYPASFGALSNVSVGGLAFSDYSQEIVALTNASGHTEDYLVTRFNGIQFGSNIVVSWS
jgi:hypothetical protein